MNSTSGKPRIAWFSPLNFGPGTTPSLSAYFSEQLLPILQSHFDIELFVDGFSPYREFTTHHYLSAVTRHKERPFDLFFYQFEDTKAGAFIRLHLGLIPGLILFHDLLVTQDGPEPILNSSWESTIEMLVKNNRQWPSRTAEFPRERPFAVREVGYAASAIFTCPRMHQEYRTQQSARPRLSVLAQDQSWYLPFPVERNDPPFPKDFTVGFAGSPRIEHRSHKVLQALSNFSGSAKLVWMIEAHEEALAREMVTEFGVENVELVAGRSPQRWNSIQKDISVGLHPLFSVFGQAEPYLRISMAAGRPSITSDFGAAEYLPSDAVFKVRPGESEAFEICSVLEKLAPSDLRAWGKRGQSWASEENDRNKIASELATIFEKSIPAIKPALVEWQRLASDAGIQLIRESQNLLESESWEKICTPVYQELGWND